MKCLFLKCFGAFCIAQCAVCSVHCTVYHVQCSVKSLHKAYSAKRSVCSVQLRAVAGRQSTDFLKIILGLF